MTSTPASDERDREPVAGRPTGGPADRSGGVGAAGAPDVSPLLPGQPAEEGEPVFREPWEAHAFAMAVRLHERGLFTWPEWAATLAEEIERAREAGDPDSGDTYYHHWLAALERLVAERGVASADDQRRTRNAWRRAAERTPHGRPIDLRATDYTH